MTTFWVRDKQRRQIIRWGRQINREGRRGERKGWRRYRFPLGGDRMICYPEEPEIMQVAERGCPNGPLSLAWKASALFPCSD